MRLEHPEWISIQITIHHDEGGRDLRAKDPDFHVAFGPPYKWQDRTLREEQKGMKEREKNTEDFKLDLLK